MVMFFSFPFAFSRFLVPSFRAYVRYAPTHRKTMHNVPFTRFVARFVVRPVITPYSKLVLVLIHSTVL